MLAVRNRKRTQESKIKFILTCYISAEDKDSMEKPARDDSLSRNEALVDWCISIKAVILTLLSALCECVAYSFLNHWALYNPILISFRA